jgi:hypothetical protein
MSTQGYRLVLLLHPALGAVRVGLDPTRLLGIRRTDPWWVIRETTRTHRWVDL